MRDLPGVSIQRNLFNSCLMKDPQYWTRDDLNAHLQHAIDLEFWTIPLYLTSLYSIKGVKDAKIKDYPSAAKLIFSVVVQEMLHMEIACNLSNALGYSPRFLPPHYGELKAIPFIHPLKDQLPVFLHDYKVNLGALDAERLKLFCVIEFPEEPGEIQWDRQHSYHSIGELYKSLQTALPYLWDKYYVGDYNNLKQKETFKAYHNSEGKSHGFSQTICSLATALKALDAIVEQGEGANAVYVPADYRPHEEFELAMKEDRLSHYQKFKSLLHHHKSLPEVYPDNNIQTEKQLVLTNTFIGLLHELTVSFNSNDSDMSPGFWQHMDAMKVGIVELWEAGACPHFELD
jgi:hypothetical protein